jgi:capsular polysaccharide biosynthesis protein/Mrp family chromosome partitioning ATPase
MTAPQLRDALLRHWKTVIVCMICTSIAAGIGTLFVTPQYQSTAVVHAVVSPATPNTYSLLVLNTLIGTEAQLALSKPILSKVAVRYEGMSAEELRKEVTTKADQNTQLFEITVTDPSPTRAASLANDLASTLILYQKQAFLDRNAQAEKKIQDQLAATQSTITTLTAKLHSSTITPSEAADTQAQLDAAKEQYTQLITTFAQLEGNDAQYAVVLRVPVVAEPNPHPVRPALTVNVAIGLACGLLLGVLLILLRVQLDQRIGNAEEVAALLDVPVLAASKPVASSGQRGKALAGETETTDLLSALHQSMDFLAVERHIRTIAVMGILDTNEAGALAASWGLSLAMGGKTTLVVDADLSRPTLHSSFELARDGGLTDAIRAASNSPNSILPVKSFLQSVTIVHAPQLAIMTAGRLSPNPDELLKSQAMGVVYGAMLATAAETILFNAPAALSRLDASVLAEHVDGVVLVIDRSRLRKHHLRCAKARLQHTTARVIGCIVIEQANTLALPRVAEQSHLQSQQPAAITQGATAGASAQRQ